MIDSKSIQKTKVIESKINSIKKFCINNTIKTYLLNKIILLSLNDNEQ